ncbi:MAG: S24 family peptidase [Thermodesulfobacteriota bacterium]
MREPDLQDSCLSSTGFSNAGEDFRGTRLNLQSLLLHNPASTFFLRCGVDTSLGGGIHQGDILVVDRALEALHRSLVVAVIHGEMLLREVDISRDRIRLLPEPPAQAWELGQQENTEIWGVVAYVIHPLCPR